MILMSIDASKKREQLFQLRDRVLQAEQERIDGAKTLNIAEYSGISFPCGYELV